MTGAHFAPGTPTLILSVGWKVSHTAMYKPFKQYNSCAKNETNTR